MQDGFRSFPSGHSSSSFAGLFFLSLYLAAKLHVLDQRGEVWRTCIVLIPTLAASCVAMSRIMDARHHPFDVLFGSTLGILVAWASYRQYFPPVSHVWEKGRAYPMRTWGAPVKRPIVGRILVDAQDGQVLTSDVFDDVDANADANADADAERAEYGMDNLEPIRAQPSSHHNQRFRSRANSRVPPSTGGPTVGDDPEMGYASIQQRQREASSPHDGSSSSPINVFHEQMSRNQQMRTIPGGGGVGRANTNPESQIVRTGGEDEEHEEDGLVGGPLIYRRPLPGHSRA